MANEGQIPDRTGEGTKCPISFSQINKVRRCNSSQTASFAADGTKADGSSSNLNETHDFFTNPAGLAFFNKDEGTAPIKFSEFETANVLTVNTFKIKGETPTACQDNDNGGYCIDPDENTVTKDTGDNQIIDILVDGVCRSNRNMASAPGEFSIMKSGTINITLAQNSTHTIKVRSRVCNNTITMTGTIPYAAGTNTACSCVQTHA